MLDKKQFPLALVMIQPPAMPGSYLNQGESFDSISAYVMKEAEMIVEMGFDGFIYKICMMARSHSRRDVKQQLS